jgi:SAM-dependent methyltransferase
MPSKAYVHGYSRREAERLADQASTLVELIHQGTAYPAGARVLEAGCGIGAQTVSLAANSPGARFTSVDISEASLAQATAAVAGRGLTNVEFTRADIFDLPLAEASFDHVFVCFLLEHLAEPERALTHLLRVLKPGGTITVVEGDHGSCYFHPETSEAVAAWRCLVDSQARLGGDSLIGRRLYPLLEGAGFGSVQVEPRMVYIDQGKPALVEGFIRRTIIPMVEGVRDQALELGLMDRTGWTKGIADLHRTAQTGGTFCYTFFKGLAVK